MDPSSPPAIQKIPIRLSKYKSPIRFISSEKKKDENDKNSYLYRKESKLLTTWLPMKRKTILTHPSIHPFTQQVFNFLLVNGCWPPQASVLPCESLLLPIFYKWKHWGPESVTDLWKDSPPLGCRAGIIQWGPPSWWATLSEWPRALHMPKVYLLAWAGHGYSKKKDILEGSPPTGCVTLPSHTPCLSLS